MSDNTKTYFSIGELARHQSISKQTLIYYDSISLFCPDYVDPDNGYRYYSVRQIDYLDTILILKRFGLSLQEIREHMEHYRADDSYQLFQHQLEVIREQIDELKMIQSRLIHKCSMLDGLKEARSGSRQTQVTVERMEEQYLLCHSVVAPYTQANIGIATKRCFAQAYEENLPVFYQSGVSVPRRHIEAERYTESDRVFLSMERACSGVSNILTIPAGLCVSTYHFGDYDSITSSYRSVLEYCRSHNLMVRSDSYEFCLNDYLTSDDENEYVTKIVFYIEDKEGLSGLDES